MEFDEKKEPSWFPNAKIYHDGSQFVAIPHTTVRRKKRGKHKEEVFVVSNADPIDKKATVLPTLEELDTDEYEELECPFEEDITAYHQEKVEEIVESVPTQANEEAKPKFERVTRASEFKRLEAECVGMSVKAKKQYILHRIKRLFKNDQAAEYYVDMKIYNEWRAVVGRRKRFMRKAFLNRFNYFATFTYDDKKHTEETFRRRLKTCLNHFCNRQDWRYMGVWERGGDTNRLHFHALVKVPEGKLCGDLETKTDFNFKTGRMRKITSHSFFDKRFGRTDFEEIVDNDMAYYAAVQYILKYVEKTGEKIVYSRKLPMYILSDINADDVLCRVGIEGKKLVLYEKFGCWDEGEYLGAISEETKKRMRTTSS